MRNIHLKESVKNGALWKALEDLSATERRTMAGMVWVLIQESMERRTEDRIKWESLAKKEKK